MPVDPDGIDWRDPEVAVWLRDPAGDDDPTPVLAGIAALEARA